MTVAVAILAAGAGTRLGGTVPKPLVVVGGRRLVDRALDAALEAALEAGLGPVFVVVGNAATEVAAAVADRAVIPIVNDRWREGIASSLVAAVGAAEEVGGVEAIVVGLADQPDVGAEAYRRVAAAYDAGASLAVATYTGVRGNPVLIARRLWAEARQLVGDEGARQLMAHHTVTEVACDGTGTPDDIDTPADLSRRRSADA